MCDWKALEAEYIAGSDGYRKLAAKYNVPESSVRDRMKNGQWYKQRMERRPKDVANAVQNIVDAVSDYQTQLATKVYRIALKIAEKLEDEIDQKSSIKSFEFKNYTGSLTDLYKMIGDMASDVSEDQAAGVVILPEREEVHE